MSLRISPVLGLPALLMWAAVASAQPKPANYPDFQNPKLDRDGRWTVTVCAQSPYVWKGKATTPHKPRITSTNGEGARARPLGDDGSLEILPDKAGETDISFDEVDLDKQQPTEHVEIHVRVIECPEPPEQIVRAPLTMTHRTTSCAACKDIAKQLNAFIDRYNAEEAKGGFWGVAGIYMSILSLSQSLDACERECRLSTEKKVAIVVGGGVGTALAIAATGGSTPAPPTASTPQTPVASTPTAPTPAPSNPTPSNPAPPTNPLPPTTPPPAPTPEPINPSGTFTVRLVVVDDPAGHDPFTGYSTVTTLTVEVSNGRITISGPPPWVTVTGNFDSTLGTFTASGTGTVAGFSNVPVTVTGTFAPKTISQMSVQVGPTNLPTNQAEKLSVTGTRP